MDTFFENNISGFRFLAYSALLSVCVGLSAHAQSSIAIVEVITEPTTTGTVRFSGTPDGKVTLPNGQLSTSELSSGSYVSTISHIDPALTAANYQLTDVSCDDGSSASPSVGNVAEGSATFNLAANETVICQFKLTKSKDESGPGDGGSGDDGNGDEGGEHHGESDSGGIITGKCLCPQEGSWNVSNQTGQMACTGVVSMTMPLKASNEKGNIETSNNCDTLTASGLSEDEETIIFQRTADCGYKGTVGGEHEGIPMEIDFTLNVADKNNMSGSLHSVVDQSGMSCTMSRDYNMSSAK